MRFVALSLFELTTSRADTNTKIGSLLPKDFLEARRLGKSIDKKNAAETFQKEVESVWLDLLVSTKPDTGVDKPLSKADFANELADEASIRAGMQLTNARNKAGQRLTELQAAAKKREKIIQDLARRLMLYLKKETANFLEVASGNMPTGKTGDQIQLDAIDRARFLFSWIARSIKYSNDINKYFFWEADNMFSLANEIHVCRGFAALFKTMFDATEVDAAQLPDVQSLLVTLLDLAVVDATTTPVNRKSKNGKDLSLSIAGYLDTTSSNRTGISTAAANTNDRPQNPNHMWSAFPYKDQFTAKTEFQLIDITQAWGYIDDNGKPVGSMDDTWFTRPSIAYSSTHRPTQKDMTFEVSKPASFELRPTKYDHRRWLDLTALEPQQKSIKGSGKTKFGVAKRCVHSRLPLPRYAIWVGPLQSFMTPSVVTTKGQLHYLEPEIRDIPQEPARVYAKTYIWSTEVALSDGNQALLAQGTSLRACLLAPLALSTPQPWMPPTPSELPPKGCAWDLVARWEWVAK